MFSDCCDGTLIFHTSYCPTLCFSRILQLMLNIIPTPFSGTMQFHYCQEAHQQICLREDFTLQLFGVFNLRNSSYASVGMLKQLHAISVNIDYFLVPSESLKAFVIYPVIRLKHVRTNLTISYINVTKLTISLCLSVIYLAPKTDSSIIKSELDREMS